MPGTDKPGLFKPGAEKLAILFKLDVQPRNEPIWGPGAHLTVISRATVYHAPTGARLGYGEGICSSREHSRAYRKRERVCPACETAAVIKGKEEFGGGWLCWRKRDGCGAKFPDGDERIEAQEVGEIENPDLPDTWNAVTKMAKKRAYADAVLSVTGASAIFTQDLGADPTEAAAATGPEHGPVVSGELKQAATQAAIRVCGGDLEQAKTLWATIQTELGGYMPEAAARALLLAAESNTRSDREAHDERAKTATRAAPDTAAGEPTVEDEAARGAPANPSPARHPAASDRDRARGERRRAGEPDPQRRRPRPDTRRPGPQRTADDAGADQRGEHRADRRAARHVLPGGRERDQRGAGRGHERRLRGAGTARGGMSGEAQRAPEPALGQVKLPERGR